MDSNELISHLGIAVSDLEVAITQYSLLTGESEPILEEVEDQKVKVAIFGRGAGRIELLGALSSDSPIAKFIDKRGPGLHHVCIYVDDLEKKLSELKAAGVKLIDEKPRVGAGGKKIAFVHPVGFNNVLIELEQS
ncbi:MAG: methylmalonyl-CoA epimerase [bacterium]|nr:methylmalonyl-CoA epimerase [bacterium]